LRKASASLSRSYPLAIIRSFSGLAMAVLEGLSYGLPVITTPVGAHPEVIEPDVSGILIPPGDAAALAGALLRLINDEGLRLRLGVGARRRFLEKFDLRLYAERLNRLPGWMQRSGLEWLFRLTTEPRRLAHRYLVDNTIFVGCAARRLAGWKFHPRDW
jgi:Glycosyl transferases group 1/Glycosyl transferase WecG/TagA/CpsF family